jgi:hypothetical protein
MGISHESGSFMVHQERLEIGEKCFVSGIMAVLATEAGLMVVTNGMHFSWAGLVLGVVGFCLILILANRLYAGNRQAHTIALGWIGFEVLYAAFALYLMVSSSQGVEMAKQIGAPAAWPVVLKVVVYLSLGWILVRMPTVRDFFAEKRGDIHSHDLLSQKAAVSPEQTSPLQLSAKQTEDIRGLAKYVRWGVAALIILGIAQILTSVVVFQLSSGNPLGILVVVQGVLSIILGMALGGPSNDIRPLTVPEEQTKGQLLDALSSLAKFYRVQAIVGLALAAVLVARIALMIPR